MLVKMKALKTFQLGDERRTVKPGDEFETHQAKHYEARRMAAVIPVAQKPTAKAPAGKSKAGSGESRKPE